MGPHNRHMTRTYPSYLRTHRKKSGLTQQEVGFLLGFVDGETVGRYERQIRKPTITTTFACQVIFDVAPRELFPGMYEKVETVIIGRVSELQARIEPDPALLWKQEMLKQILERADSRRTHI